MFSVVQTFMDKKHIICIRILITLAFLLKLSYFKIIFFFNNYNMQWIFFWNEVSKIILMLLSTRILFYFILIKMRLYWQIYCIPFLIAWRKRSFWTGNRSIGSLVLKKKKKSTFDFEKKHKYWYLISTLLFSNMSRVSVIFILNNFYQVLSHFLNA